MKKVLNAVDIILWACYNIIEDKDKELNEMNNMLMNNKFVVMVNTPKGTHVATKCSNNIIELEKWVNNTYPDAKNFSYKML